MAITSCRFGYETMSGTPATAGTGQLCSTGTATSSSANANAGRAGSGGSQQTGTSGLGGLGAVNGGHSFAGGAAGQQQSAGAGLLGTTAASTGGMTTATGGLDAGGMSPTATDAGGVSGNSVSTGGASIAGASSGNEGGSGTVSGGGTATSGGDTSSASTSPGGASAGGTGNGGVSGASTEGGAPTTTDAGSAGTPAAGVNNRPVAVASVSPRVAEINADFQFSAASSSDAEDPLARLRCDWDWNGDGTIDASGIDSVHAFAVAGSQFVTLTVTDSGNLSDFARIEVVTTATGALCVVTTAADESDANATPAAPGGTGFSLREAINYANQTTVQQTIQIPNGLTLLLGSVLPDLLDSAGTVIFAEGAIVDGSGASGPNPCLSISSDNNRITGLEIHGCVRPPIEITSGQGNQLDHLYLHDNGRELTVYSPNNRIGPANRIETSATNGVSLYAANVTVDQNLIQRNSDLAISLGGPADGARIIGNVLARNARGFDVGTGCNDVVIYHNVIDSNTTYGGIITANVSGTDFQANLITSNGGRGVSGFDANYLLRDYNDWWNNVGTACSGCSALGAYDLTIDPQYVDAASGDYRLLSTSPVRDAAPSLGYDANGAAPGDYWDLPPMGPYDVRP